MLTLMKSIEADYHKAYYQRNKAKWKVYAKRDYRKRRDAIAAQRATPEQRAKRFEYLKGWRAKNVEKRAADMRKWTKKNKAYLRAYRAAYGPRRRELYQKRREEILARKREMAPRYAERVNRYKRNQRVTNIQYMLKDRIRATLGRALRRQFVKKSKRTMELVGCTPRELKAHIEAQFVDGMTWETRHLWHVDHRRPLGSFDLRDIEQQRQAMHFTNLQPLWSQDNHRKSNKRL
jgi:hypothetical protein